MKIDFYSYCYYCKENLVENIYRRDGSLKENYYYCLNDDCDFGVTVKNYTNVVNIDFIFNDKGVVFKNKNNNTTIIFEDKSFKYNPKSNNMFQIIKDLLEGDIQDLLLFS